MRRAGLAGTLPAINKRPCFTKRSRRIACIEWHAQLDVKDACNVARLLVHERGTKCAGYTSPVQPKSRAAVLGCLIPLAAEVKDNDGIGGHCLLLKMIYVC